MTLPQFQEVVYDTMERGGVANMPSFLFLCSEIEPNKFKYAFTAFDHKEFQDHLPELRDKLRQVKDSEHIKYICSGSLSYLMQVEKGDKSKDELDSEKAAFYDFPDLFDDSRIGVTLTFESHFASKVVTIPIEDNKFLFEEKFEEMLTTQFMVSGILKEIDIFN